jgi:hypothetical protein
MFSTKRKILGVLMGILPVFALGVLAASPGDSAYAAKMDKASVCHFQEEVVDADTGEVVESSEWTVINVNENSLPAHLGDLDHAGHGDGEYMDQLVDDDPVPAADTVSSEDCLARNPVLG